MKRHVFATILLLVLCLTLTGCGDGLLERSYSSVVPHSAVYWENEDADTLRAENYQDLVNALLLLLSEHSEDGVVRIYGDAPNKAAMASDACVEVQKETPIGAYLLDYITYDGKSESAYYELTVRFGYRRTAEEQNALVNVTSTEALPDLLRAAIEEGRGAFAIRVGYFATDRDGVLALVAAVHDEVYPPAKDATPESGESDTTGENPDAAPEDGGTDEPPADAETAPPQGEAPEENKLPDGGAAPGAETPADAPDTTPEPVYDLSPWQVNFYPDDQPGIIEVVLAKK